MKSGVPEYFHLIVADVHVSNVAGTFDHAKLGTGVGRGKSELATVGGWDVVVGRRPLGMDMALVSEADVRVAIDDFVCGLG